MGFRPQFSKVNYSNDYRNMLVLADNRNIKCRKV